MPWLSTLYTRKVWEAPSLPSPAAADKWQPMFGDVMMLKNKLYLVDFCNGGSDKRIHVLVMARLHDAKV